MKFLNLIWCAVEIPPLARITRSGFTDRLLELLALTTPKFGGPPGVRTRIARIKSPAISQLLRTVQTLVDELGFEPRTFGLKVRRNYQLCYTSKNKNAYSPPLCKRNSQPYLHGHWAQMALPKMVSMRRIELPTTRLKVWPLAIRVHRHNLLFRYLCNIEFGLRNQNCQPTLS